MLEFIGQLVRRKKWTPWKITCRCRATMDPNGGYWNSIMYRCFNCGRLAVVYGKRDPGFGPGAVTYYVPEHWLETKIEEFEELLAEKEPEVAVSSAFIESYPYDIEDHVSP
jgi:hypothetical protein